MSWPTPIDPSPLPGNTGTPIAVTARSSAPGNERTVSLSRREFTSQRGVEPRSRRGRRPPRRRDGPCDKGTCCWMVPSLLPIRTETLRDPPFDTARSGMPSAFHFPVATQVGLSPVPRFSLGSQGTVAVAQQHRTCVVRPIRGNERRAPPSSDGKAGAPRTVVSPRPLIPLARARESSEKGRPTCGLPTLAPDPAARAGDIPVGSTCCLPGPARSAESRRSAAPGGPCAPPSP